ncbi:cobalamin biosynthesis protein [Mycolicibacterium neoaurum]|uniref:cobalamin biosynthesis protein n=1 Tax=Mycolicibacterium neoaurum TaxID=1795 RepID=UPI0026725108|nr:cobalamin biosynthesis protein [Mycolicibacterium neoaurum]MDO3401609.1 cobalamin biosynthesis protein [Mycolicibacterium neoaurum]
MFPEAGLLTGFILDRRFGDPGRLHPVAGFGIAASAWESSTYRDNRFAGVVHSTTLLFGATIVGAVLRTCTRRRRLSSISAMAAGTWVCLGGTTLCRTGAEMAELLEEDQIEASQQLLPSLCGRDPATLDHTGLTRAALESIAENTSDAAVAPLLWAAIAGLPGICAYRAANTLDAMIGYRSERYRRFGWAAARTDDVLNYPAARVTALLAMLCSPLVGGTPRATARAWFRDARKHPSPNAGVVESSFAGALGIRLGGLTAYSHGIEERPVLGDGRIPQPADLRRAVELSAAVQLCAAALLPAAASGVRLLRARKAAS